MAYALLAHTALATETGGTTPAIDTTGADLLVVLVTQYSDSTPPSLSDSKGNTWTARPRYIGRFTQVRLYYCRGGSVGAGHTFSLSVGDSFYGTIEVAAFSGSVASPFEADVFSNAGSLSVTSLATGSLTPSMSGSLLIAGIDPGDGTGLSIDSGFAITDFKAPVSGQNQGGGLAYLIQGAAAPVNPTFSWTLAQDCVATLAVFQGALSSNDVNGGGTFGALLGEGLLVIPNTLDGVGLFGPLSATATNTQTPFLTGEGWLGGLSASGTGNAQTPGFQLVAHTAAATNTTGTTAAIDTGGADLLVANVTQYQASALGVLSDSKGNTWTPLTARSGAGARDRLFYCQGAGISVGAGHTFTLTQSDSFYGSLQVAAFRGSGGGATAEAGAVATAVTSIRPGTVLPTQPGALIVSGMVPMDGTSGVTIADGFTITDYTPWTSGVTEGGALAYLIQSGPTQPVNPTWSWTGSAWETAASIAVFNAVLSENLLTGSGGLGALAADGVGGMAATLDGGGTFPSIFAEGVGGMQGDASGSGLFGPLSAAGIIVQPNFVTGEGTFGPLGASGTGAATQALIGKFLMRPAGKAFVLDTVDHSLALHKVPGTAPAPASFPLTATITIGGMSYPFHEVDGTDLGDYQDPLGAFTQHCIRAVNPGLPDFRTYFRNDADGSRNEVVFELGSIFSGTPANMASYTAVITRDDGTVLATFNVPRHDWFSRWRWYSAERPARTTAAALQAANLIPKFDFSLIAGHPPAMQGAATYAPMGLAGQGNDMSAGGGGPEIGPVTQFQGEWLATGNASSYRSMIAQAEAAGTWSWHHRDEGTGAPLNAITYPHASIQSADAATPVLAKIAPNNWDTPHQPALNYLPFLLTGDPYYLEGLQFQANSTIYHQPWTFRPTYNVFDAIRAWAWSTRTMACAAKVTPDTVPAWLLPKSYFKQNLDGNRDYVMATFVNRGIEPYITHRTFERQFGDGDPSSPAGTYTQPYMEAYCGIVLNWIAAMFPTEPLWMQAAVWKGDQGVKRTNGTSGWNRAYVSPYRQYLRVSTADPWLNWADSWALTASRFGFDPAADSSVMQDPITFDYPQIWYAAIAPLASMGVPGAAECATWLRGQIQAQNNALSPGAVQHKWCIST